jgi:hypothetical protein
MRISYVSEPAELLSDPPEPVSEPAELLCPKDEVHACADACEEPSHDSWCH